jgi:hypothetical protein
LYHIARHIVTAAVSFLRNDANLGPREIPMMPTIQLSDETFGRLQSLAVPFVDTPESVIKRLLDETSGAKGADGTQPALGTDAVLLNPDYPGSLSYTRVRTASINSKPLHQPHWNKIMRELHVLALKELGSFEALRKASGSNLREGKYETEGFTHLNGAGFSIQGVDSNFAWQHSLALAKKLALPLEVTFTWYDKEGAAYPGKWGALSWEPK